MRQDRQGKNYQLPRLDLVALNNILIDIGRRLSQAEGVGQSPDYKGKRLVNVGNPTQDGDAVNLATLEARIAGLSTTGATATTTTTNVETIINTVELVEADSLTEKELVSTDYLVVFEQGDPQYKKARAADISLVPAGVIVMWSGTLASIPAGYALCDGTGGTPDLRDKFIYGWSDGVDPGDTGGAVDHKHSTTVPGHDHTVDVGTTTSGAPSATETVDNDGTLSTVAVASATHTHDTDPAQVTSGATTNTAVDSDTVSNLPPYYKLAYLMKI